MDLEAAMRAWRGRWVGLAVLAGIGLAGLGDGWRGGVMDVVGDGVVAAARYEEGARLLTVLFRDGAVVRFHDVGPEQYRGWCKADDKAEFLYRELREGCAIEFVSRPGDRDGRTREPTDSGGWQ